MSSVNTGFKLCINTVMKANLAQLVSWSAFGNCSVQNNTTKFVFLMNERKTGLSLVLNKSLIKHMSVIVSNRKLHS